MAVKPGTVAAFALAVLGLGLIAAAFVGETFAMARLVLGLVLLMAALITAGASTLLVHGGSSSEKEGT